MPPWQAHAPKATNTFDFSRNILAISSCSVLRMAPLNRHKSMLLSGIFLTSLYLKSMAIGQKTMSDQAGDFQDFLVRIEDSHITAAAGRRPV